MTRPKLNYPENQDSWNHFPQEFLDYLNVLDEIRKEHLAKEVIDPLYSHYDYEWEMDDEIPFRTVLEYWNDDKDLPEPDLILDEINDCMAETSYDDWVSSFYSY